MRFASVHDHYFRITESIDSARMILSGVFDTYRGTIAERTNDVMKLLTVFSVILLPLSLLAGLYGMNFEHIPELGWRWGYFILLGLMATIAAGLWRFFARRGFVGQARVGDIPGAVGRGLVDLVGLTTKPAVFASSLKAASRPDGGERPAERAVEG